MIKLGRPTFQRLYFVPIRAKRVDNKNYLYEYSEDSYTDKPFCYNENPYKIAEHPIAGKWKAGYMETQTV